MVFVADGAKWLWHLVERNFPQAVQIVDGYHAVAYLSPIAKALYERSSDADSWYRVMSDKLWHSQVEAVIQSCLALANHPHAAEAALSAAVYYDNNRHRMDYATYRQQGYLIGTGTIESRCKQIATVRLKRSGTRWTKAGAVTTAEARAAWLSHQWPFAASHYQLLAVAA